VGGGHDQATAGQENKGEAYHCPADDSHGSIHIVKRPLDQALSGGRIQRPVKRREVPVATIFCPFCHFFLRRGIAQWKTAEKYGKNLPEVSDDASAEGRR
jgi:hypothetical protein